jgi:hypothetical protein
MRIDFGNIIFIVIVVVVFAASIIKKLKEMVEGQVERGQDVRVDYEATPAEIQDFLRSITAGQRQEVNVEAPPAAPQPAQVRRQARPAEAPAGRSFWDALEGPVPAAPAAAAPVTPKAAPRRRKRPRREPAAPPAQAVKPPEAPAPEKAKAAAGLTPLALKGMDLKQAFAWSEILAPPVALRRRSRQG